MFNVSSKCVFMRNFFIKLKNTIKSALLIGFIVFSGNGASHTYYEGFSDIRVNVVKERIEIIHHFTTHDLEILLSKKFNERVSADRPNYLKHLKNYINENFKLSLNNEPLKIQWSGIENGINETVIYQAIEKIKSLNNIKVTNQVLISFYPEQINRVNYKDASVENKILSGTLIFDENKRVQIITNSNN